MQYEIFCLLTVADTLLVPGSRDAFDRAPRLSTTFADVSDSMKHGRSVRASDSTPDLRSAVSLFGPRAPLRWWKVWKYVHC